MQNIKKYFMTLALLITAVTGAWAQTAFGVKEITADMLPASWSTDNSAVTADDLAKFGFMEVTEAEAQAWTGAPQQGNVRLIYTPCKSVNWVKGEGGYSTSSYTRKIFYSCLDGQRIFITTELTEWDLTPDADKKVWTLAEMPASNIELQVEYYAESNIFLGKEALANKANISVLNGSTAVDFNDEGKSTTTVMEGNTVTAKFTGKKVIGMTVAKKAKGKTVTLATPLTVEAITPGTIRVNIEGTLSSGMKYSVNGGTKTLITKSTDITLAKDDKVQFYGNGTQTQVYGDETVVEIKGDGDGFKTKVYGNIMSLLDEEGFATKTELPNASYVFYGLFTGNTTLIDASELLLPATTMTFACYYGMFNGCTSLTTAPKLPATTLAKYCYYGMFTGCTSLTSAYVKAAYTGGNDECTNMFIGCPATGAVLHTTPDSKASWENVMGSGKTWSNWSVADDWQE